MTNRKKNTQKDTKKLCLNMIVKNEMANLPRCLGALADHIDCWVIADTGSTDGTQDFIKSFFAEHGIAGELHNIPFNNFEQARNDGLERAYASPLAYDYVLLADADMELVVEDKDFRNRLNGPGYGLLQRGPSGLAYWNTRIIERKSGARYHGVTHEYLDVPGGVKELKEAWYKDHASGSNRVDKFERDIQLLLQALKKDPENARYWFYLAQSYRDAGRTEEAAKAYAKRADMGGWEEEAWTARLEEARCLRKLGDEGGFLRQALAAFNRQPRRGEPLYDLARFYREKGMNDASVLFSEPGLALPRPEGDILFLEDFVYTSGLQEEYSISANYARDPARKDRGFAACNWLALNRTIPENSRNLARSNLYFYVQPAGTILPSFTARPVGFTPPDGYRPMNPSVARQGGEIVLVQRSVNYAMSPSAEYVTSDDAPIHTRNFLLRLSDALEIRSAAEILPPTDLPEPAYSLVLGFEDLRPFVWRGELWASACVRQLSSEGWCEQVLVRIDERVGGACRLTDWRVLHPEGPRLHEKNWMPQVDKDTLRFFYACDPTRILDEHARDFSISTPAIAADMFRGGTQAMAFEGGWLTLTHESRVMAVDNSRFYQHRFVWFDEKNVLRGVSRPFFLHKKGVEFAGGLAWHPDGKRLLISYSIADSESWIASVGAAEVRALLEDAENLPSGKPTQPGANISAIARNGGHRFRPCREDVDARTKPGQDGEREFSHCDSLQSAPHPNLLPAKDAEREQMDARVKPGPEMLQSAPHSDPFSVKDAEREQIGARVKPGHDSPPPRRTFTIHGTALYLDQASGELRHGPPASVPFNARFVSGGGHGYIACEADGLLQSIICLPERCQTISSAGQGNGSAAPTMLEIVRQDGAWVGLKAEGKFLCAETDGSLTLSRAECNAWERFLLDASNPPKSTAAEFHDLAPFLRAADSPKERREQSRAFDLRIVPFLDHAAGALPQIHCFYEVISDRAEHRALIAATSSMRAAGHAVKVWSYSPEKLEFLRASGIELRSADDVLPKSLFERIVNESEIRYFSDVFRYAVLYEHGGLWMDGDVILLRPFPYRGDHFFNLQWRSDANKTHFICGNVMYAEPYSRHMRALYEASIERFFAAPRRDFGAIGPKLLSDYVMSESGAELRDRVFSPMFFNSIDWTEIDRFDKPLAELEDYLNDERVFGIHLWTARNIPRPSGNDAPLLSLLTDPLAGFPSFINIADRFNTDKNRHSGNSHCYARIYDRLLSSRRFSLRRLMEIGLCRGLAERNQTETPSVALWQSYFPFCELIGVDITDFSAINNARFTSFVCDQSKLADLRAVAARIETGSLDVIIDDGSHASFDQQLTMREFWPLLADGGWYFIEDLDWQPSGEDARRIALTKTLMREIKEGGQALSFDPLGVSALAGEFEEVLLFDSHYELTRAKLLGGLVAIRKRGGSGLVR